MIVAVVGTTTLAEFVDLACLSKLKESIRAASHCSVYHSYLKSLGFLRPRLLTALVMHSIGLG